jgi:hypothetical protein
MIYVTLALNSLTLHFVFASRVIFSIKRVRFISLNIINQMIFVTEKCCVFFDVRTEFLNIV